MRDKTVHFVYADPSLTLCGVPFWGRMVITDLSSKEKVTCHTCQDILRSWKEEEKNVSSSQQQKRGRPKKGSRENSQGNNPVQEAVVSGPIDVIANEHNATESRGGDDIHTIDVSNQQSAGSKEGA